MRQTINMLCLLLGIVIIFAIMINSASILHASESPVTKELKKSTDAIENDLKLQLLVCIDSCRLRGGVYLFAGYGELVFTEQKIKCRCVNE